MVHVEGEIIINRPVDVMFDFAADERNEPRYNPSMLRVGKVSNGPIGLGTRFRAETTSMGRFTEMIIEFTAYERPLLLASSTHLSDMDIQGTLRFDSIRDRTRMRRSWDLKPRGVLRLMTLLIRRMGQRQEERNWENLKDFLEAQETPGQS
jgi:polyketide cyclase/dehydrase/lipid transport protein